MLHIILGVLIFQILMTFIVWITLTQDIQRLKKDKKEFDEIIKPEYPKENPHIEIAKALRDTMQSDVGKESMTRVVENLRKLDGVL